MALLYPFSMVVRNQDLTQGWEVSDFAEQAEWGTVAPGGCLRLTYKLKRDITRPYPDYGYAFDVRLFDGDGIFWRGRMEDFRFTRQGTTEYIEISVLGGAVNSDDQFYTSKILASGTTLQAAYSTVRADLMPLISAESLETTGRSLAADLDVSGLRARDVLKLLRDYGNSSDNDLWWDVYPRASDGAYILNMYSRPTTIAYRFDIDYADSIAAVGLFGNYFADRIRVFYNAGASNLSVQNTTLQGAPPLGYSTVREARVILPNVTSATDATNVGNTILKRATAFRIASQDIEISHAFAVRGSVFQRVPLWRVRAGNLVYLEGMMPSGVPGVTDWRNTVLITETHYSSDSGRLRLSFEKADAQIEGIMASLTDDIAV